MPASPKNSANFPEAKASDPRGCHKYETQIQVGIADSKQTQHRAARCSMGSHAPPRHGRTSQRVSWLVAMTCAATAPLFTCSFVGQWVTGEDAAVQATHANV